MAATQQQDPFQATLTSLQQLIEHNALASELEAMASRGSRTLTLPSHEDDSTKVRLRFIATKPITPPTAKQAVTELLQAQQFLIEVRHGDGTREAFTSSSIEQRIKKGSLILRSRNDPDNSLPYSSVTANDKAMQELSAKTIAAISTPPATPEAPAAAAAKPAPAPMPPPPPAPAAAAKPTPAPTPPAAPAAAAKPTPAPTPPPPTPAPAAAVKPTPAPAAAIKPPPATPAPAAPQAKADLPPVSEEPPTSEEDANESSDK